MMPTEKNVRDGMETKKVTMWNSVQKKVAY